MIQSCRWLGAACALAIFTTACGPAAKNTAAPVSEAAAATPVSPWPGDLALRPDMPVFCLDDTGVYQPMQNTNLGRLAAAFQQQFGWVMSQGGKDRIDDLEFYWLHFAKSAPPADGEESIGYAVEPHQGGIALLKMIANLDGMETDVKGGTAMCWQTFGLINDKP